MIDMNENEVRKGMIKYFASKGVKVIPSKIKEAWPDFHIDTIAIEVNWDELFSKTSKEQTI